VTEAPIAQQHADPLQEPIPGFIRLFTNRKRSPPRRVRQHRRNKKLADKVL